MENVVVAAVSAALGRPATLVDLLEAAFLMPSRYGGVSFYKQGRVLLFLDDATPHGMAVAKFLHTSASSVSTALDEVEGLAEHDGISVDDVFERYGDLGKAMVDALREAVKAVQEEDPVSGSAE